MHWQPRYKTRFYNDTTIASKIPQGLPKAQIGTQSPLSIYSFQVIARASVTIAVPSFLSCILIDNVYLQSLVSISNCIQPSNDQRRRDIANVIV